MIPNYLHFVFGMAADFGGKPFSLIHYLAIKSAIEVNQPEKTFFHYQYEPNGDWWQKIKPLLTLNQLEAPAQIFGNKLYHVAHQADVVRLQVLHQYGGIYLDLDTLSKKPLTPFLNNQFVIGEQFAPKYAFYNHHLMRIAVGIKRMNKQAFTQPAVEGLCNAVMLSAPESKFVTLWLDAYKTFRSKGRDAFWGEHSVFVPKDLAIANPQLLTIANPYCFHYPLYSHLGLKYIFEKDKDYPNAYLHHVWESHSWEKYLKNLTVDDIKSRNTSFNRIARNFL
jgi:signal recognition particle subunit SEC65